METELQTLINELHKEIEALEAEILECIAMNFFQEAEYLQQIIWSKKWKLNSLKNLENPNHRKIEQIEKLIEGRKKKNLRGEYYLQTLDDLERELIDLKSLKPKRKIDSDIIFSSIEKLIDKDTDYISIVMKGGRYRISLERHETTIEIYFAMKAYDNLRGSLSSYGLKVLGSLGFSIEKGGAVKNFSTDDEKLPSYIMMSISVICLEVLGLHGQDLGELILREK